jgi:MFS family permease
MARKEPCFAWFVVFCSFMLHLITDGVAYTFGIFFTALLEDLHSSKALAAWVPSIMTGLTYGVGPLAAALTDRYGCRRIALFGTSLTAFGFAIASMAGGVVALYGSIGVLAGAGFGLIYLPAVVCLTQHFTRHLALATGLAVSASGIGTALFAPLTEQLVQRYGWRIAMRCVAVLLFFSGMFALSFGSPVTSGQSTPEDSALDDDDSRKKMVHFSHSRRGSLESLNHRKNYHFFIALFFCISTFFCVATSVQA